MILQRLLAPGSKLAMTSSPSRSRRSPPSSGSRAPTRTSSTLALDWLLARQQPIESRPGAPPPSRLGRSCSTTSPRPTSRAAAARWRSWATRAIASRGTPQIVYGLVCARTGCPIAVEVFERLAPRRQDAARPDREAQAALRALQSVIVVSDLGMVTKANLELLPRDRRRRLDHGAQGAADQEAGQAGRPAAVAVRRAQPGRDRRRRLPARAARRLPQPAGRRGAGAQARASCCGDRARVCLRSNPSSSRGTLRGAGRDRARRRRAS